MRLGGPVFEKTDDPRELAKAHRKMGYRAAYCPKADLNDAARIREISDAFAAEDVVIAEVGAWCNMIDLDLDVRKKNVDHVIERLALADEVGALCCVNIAGSFNPDDWAGPHPENVTTRAFELIMETIRKIIDAVKPKRTKFAIEMMQWVIPDSPESYVELLLAVNHPALAVHLDPTNLINCPRRYFDTTSVIRECFERLGDKVVSCHAKDVILHDGAIVHLDEIMPGKGKLDYREYLTQLSLLPHEPPLMIEHLRTPEEYGEARNHIMEVADVLGLSFEHQQAPTQ